MKKFNFTKEWFMGFSSNLMGVLIGIVLTFGITFYVQHRQEKKQLREMVALLKREVADNKKWLKSRADEWDKDFEAYWVVLWEQDWNSIPHDTLQAKVGQLLTHNISYSASYVWGIFQSSGMVQKLHNTELVATLSECYFWSDEMRNWWKAYNAAKDPVSDIYVAEYSDKPLEYFKALKQDAAARKLINDVAMHNVYSFRAHYSQFAPYYDYVLFLLDNYDKPRKTQNVDFEAFVKMQEDENNRDTK